MEGEKFKVTEKIHGARALHFFPPFSSEVKGQRSKAIVYGRPTFVFILRQFYIGKKHRVKRRRIIRTKLAIRKIIKLNEKLLARVSG